MRILLILGIFILWRAQSVVSTVTTQTCKNMESTPELRLRKQIFCNYDNTVRPNHLKTNVSVVINLIPKVVDFGNEWFGGLSLSLHSWMSLSWEDPNLAWTPSEHDGITAVHVKSWEVWTPDLCVFTSDDMSSNECHLPLSECLVYNDGSVLCVSAAKLISRCKNDFTNWPYDKHQCNLTFGSWGYSEEEIDLRLFQNKGIDMTNFSNSTEWDFKFVRSSKQIKKFECCPHEAYPTITYSFLLKRYHDIKHINHVVPAIILMFLTILVLWLDPKSIERMLIASVNIICHLIWTLHLFWHLPFNRNNPPTLIIYYGESTALATYAIILTALLRKLEDTNTKMPNWISSATSFVVSNKAGRFLVLDDKDFEVTDDDATNDETSKPPGSRVKIKELSWRHFASVVSWLSLLCVVLVYIVILIVLMPVRSNL